MRILLVSYYFPPYNTIGAVRTGKTARYLSELGHDVRVLTAGKQPLEATLPLEIPAERVLKTAWLDVNKPIELALGGRRRIAARGFTPPAACRSTLQRLGAAYRTLVNFPDGQIGWWPFAVRAGSRLIRQWRPDLILGSALPPTSLLVASWLARRHQIPWVAELRDLWANRAGFPHPDWRRRLEMRLERRTLSSAAALVTVSQPLADQLFAEYARPVEVILNGFDPNDMQPTAPPDGGKLVRIVYTGMIYQGRQNLEPLFQALALLGARAEGFRVEFYGRYLAHVMDLARRYGVAEQVQVHSPVPYRAALEIQQAADLLLLLLEVDPRERGVYTGKLFEYFGARRPILAIGPHGNVAADLVVSRQAGVALSGVDEIARHLWQWHLEKQSQGSIASPPASALAGLSRQEQTARLDGFLRQVLQNHGPARSLHDRPLVVGHRRHFSRASGKRIR